MFGLKFFGVIFLCVALSFSKADKFCRQGLFKKVQGECVTTSNTLSLHVGSMLDCSHQCLKKETCAVFKYRLSTQKSGEANCKLGQKLESCSQIDPENKDSAWEVYKMIQVKLPVCLDKSICQNGGECTKNPYEPDGFECVCRKYFAGKFCEQRTGYHSSCKSLLQTEGDAKNGPYKIKTNTASGFSNIYCQMTSLPGCSGGGWTMVMKIDGNKLTFSYDSSHWLNNSTPYNINGGTTAFDQQETKLPTYWSTSFTELCIGMEVNENVNFTAINYTASSLYSLIADGKYRATNIGRQKWKSLITNSSLQSNCGQEGFNIYADKHASVRLGIIGNEQNHCSSPDSFLGFGARNGRVSGCPGYEGQSGPITCGNAAKCFNTAAQADTFIPAMGYILVR